MAGDRPRRRPTASPSLGGPVGTSLGRDEYIHAVEVAKDAIAAGEAIQVVLARRQSFDLPEDPATGVALDGIGLYRSLRRVNPSPYLFFVRTPTFEVVGASPELLLQVEGDKLTTHPIAGTRPRGANDREDALLSEELQADPKERAEHVMLVDLGRNDLGRVARAGTVTVSKYMEVERYSHVLHLVSHVEARLKPELDALDALRSVFPAGTLSGAPKVRAMQLIAAAEGERRGLYGGAVGYLGYDGNLDTAITIRSAVLKEGQAHVHTGAGIVAGSVPEREFEETEHKAAALRRAIEMAAGVSEARRPGGRRPRSRRDRGPAVILVIDNYDSFTFNLVQALQAAGAEVHVVRNDAIEIGAVAEMADDPAAGLRGIVISPGPGDPDDAGISVGAVKVAADRALPLLGRLPRDAVDGRRVRRDDRPRPDPRPWRGVRGHPRRRRPARGHAAVVHGGPLSLAGDRPRDTPPGAAGDRDERGRPGDHGHPARRRCRSRASSSTRNPC